MDVGCFIGDHVYLRHWVRPIFVTSTASADPTVRHVILLFTVYNRRGRGRSQKGGINKENFFSPL